MAIKKTELYTSLWASCDELRGGMDASQYKNYILTLLFVKYVSDKYQGKKLGAIAVPEGGSFDDMVAQKCEVFSWAPYFPLLDFQGVILGSAMVA